jgi:hypothetical protein
MYHSQSYIDACHHEFYTSALALYAACPHDASDLAVRVLLQVTRDPGAARRFGAFLGMGDKNGSEGPSQSDYAQTIRCAVSAEAGTVPVNVQRIDGVIAHLRELEVEVEDSDPVAATGVWTARMDLLTSLGRDEEIDAELAAVDVKVAAMRAVGISSPHP